MEAESTRGAHLGGAFGSGTLFCGNNDFATGLRTRETREDVIDGVNVLVEGLRSAERMSASTSTLASGCDAAEFFVLSIARLADAIAGVIISALPRSRTTAGKSAGMTGGVGAAAATGTLVSVGVTTDEVLWVLPTALATTVG